MAHLFKQYNKTINVLITLVFLLCSTPSLAADGLSKRDAIRKAQKRNGGGKVLAVKERNNKGALSYEIKLISAGKVKVYRIPSK
jgi:uncharacterized membrane protein YkoI